MLMQLLAAAALLAATPALNEAAVPADQEPHHKSIFKNAYVQVFRAPLNAGESSQMHIHTHDDIAVRLTHSTVSGEMLGQPAGAPSATVPGMLSARDIEGKTYTHRVHNVGTTIFDVLDIELLLRPPGLATPALLKPAVENASMRAYRYDLAPGANSSEHTHTRPYLLVAATDIDLHMSSPDGRTVAHPVKAGEVHWVEQGITHMLGNRGRQDAILVEIELK
jgi:quercetin dioxygenase-like cupin family protein